MNDLAKVQQVLARLYTDTVLRESFFANPQKVGAELGLKGDEIKQLAQLSAPAVNLFAKSLKRKRLGEIRYCLPLTQRVLGKDFSQLFWQYAETYLPEGIKKHQQDALQFCTFIEKVLLSKGIEPSWVLDIVRYEKARLQIAKPTRRFVCCRFRYAIKPLIESLQQSHDSPVLLAKPTVGIWLRLWPKGKFRWLVVNG